MMSQDPVRVYLKVSGRVQGVFFRASAAARAQELGVTGWVRNHYDGTVELCAEGQPYRVEELIEWCRHGPPGARVEEVTVQRQSFRGEFRRFTVER
jgi:acylphosphatase